MPKLLVSVRNAPETTAALAGGCQILDIKEPSRGSLGRADRETITQILNLVDAWSTPVQTSLALGELLEWDADLPVSSDWNRVHFLKAGTAGVNSQAAWVSRSRALRQKFAQAGILQPAWIAVVYVDLIPADFWETEALRNWTQTIRSEKFGGVLLDTWEKQTGSLESLTARNPATLNLLLAECHNQQLLCALAGRLTCSDINHFLQQQILPDLFAVRSAVCAQGDRKAAVQEHLVRDLVDLLSFQQTSQDAS